MRLWHYKMIPYLPRLQLLSQHREAAALRGLGWNKKHKTVDYIFKHSYLMLYNYHMLVIEEMENRSYKVDQVWKDIKYRGKNKSFEHCIFNLPNYNLVSLDIYPEHNDAYLIECTNNLINKMQIEPWKYSQEDFKRINTFLLISDQMEDLKNK